MKKILLVVFMSLCVSFAWAQGVSGGLKAGVNFANQTASNSNLSASGSSITSFHGGFYLTAMFSDKIGLQPELLYSGQGTEDDSNPKTKITLGYLNVPVLLRFQVIPALNFHLGPQVGFLLNANASSGSNSVDVKDGFNGIDFGAAFGAGFDAGAFNGGVRYNLGLSNIAKNAPSGTSLKNTDFQIYIGVRLFGAGE